jgi:hypothetical protein
MQKLCTHCETLFTPKENHRGSEQVYCSIKCRTSAAQQRMINKIKENAIQETRQSSIVAENNSNISGNRMTLNKEQTILVLTSLGLWNLILKPETRLVSLS